jgi:hypothetical protein
MHLQWWRLLPHRRILPRLWQVYDLIARRLLPILPRTTDQVEKRPL